jgi:hypothetical protein
VYWVTYMGLNESIEHIDQRYKGKVRNAINLLPEAIKARKARKEGRKGAIEMLTGTASLLTNTTKKKGPMQDKE